MKLDGNELAAHLKRRLDALYVVVGDEPLLELEAVDAIRAAARSQGYSEHRLLMVEPGFDWNALLISANNLSLFAQRQLVELRIPNGKPGTEGAQALRRYVAGLPGDTVSLMVLGNLERAQMSADWFLALSEAGVVVQVEAVARDRLPRWIAARLAQQQHQADAATLEYLADRVEGNLLAARNEIDKLALLFPPGALQFEQVKQAVVGDARFDVWDLVSATLAGNASRVARAVASLKAAGDAPPLALWAISEEIRALLRIKQGLARGRPTQELYRANRVWGPRQALVERALARLSETQLQQALRQSASVDRCVKGVGEGEPWELLLRLCLSLAGLKLPRELAA